MSKHSSITENVERKRFELLFENETAFVEYLLTKDGQIYLTHTEVPKKIEGKGVGFELIGQVLPIIEERNLKLVPLCPFVATFIRRNTEWKRILADNINI